MAVAVPNSRPKMKEADVLQLLAPYALNAYPVRLLGVRGYYKQTMGNPLRNDTGMYDDAIFVVSPDGFASFNANTDPSVIRKGVAVLKPGGPYLYKVGLHNMKNPYTALRQYGRVTVLRDGKEETDTAAEPFYIDIHKGGINTTSSLGCQTIALSQWMAFLNLVKDWTRRHEQKIIPYVLVEL